MQLLNIQGKGLGSRQEAMTVHFDLFEIMDGEQLRTTEATTA